MSVDIFGREGKPHGQGGRKGDPGIGFNLTSDGNFDLRNKRLTSIGDVLDDADAASKKYVDGSIHKSEQILFDFLSSDMEKIGILIKQCTNDVNVASGEIFKQVNTSDQLASDKMNDLVTLINLKFNEFTTLIISRLEDIDIKNVFHNLEKQVLILINNYANINNKLESIITDLHYVNNTEKNLKASLEQELESIGVRIYNIERLLDNLKDV